MQVYIPHIANGHLAGQHGAIPVSGHLADMDLADLDQWRHLGATTDIPVEEPEETEAAEPGKLDAQTLIKAFGSLSAVEKQAVIKVMRTPLPQAPAALYQRA